MAYVKHKRINGHDYYYLVESYRADGKVKTRNLKYLGKNPALPVDVVHPKGLTEGRYKQKTLWEVNDDA